MTEGSFSQIADFTEALAAHESLYGIHLDTQQRARLRVYYEQVSAWNARLHLVASSCSPAEFATRHVLESLVALREISRGAHVIDVGSGGGLPIIPCLIVRPDIRATLIEASPRKAVFLREALRQARPAAETGAGGGAATEVIADRFENITAPAAADYVTCRALDRFTRIFPKLTAWSPAQATLLFFGGPTLRSEVERARGLRYTAHRLPLSEQRFLFVIRRTITDA